MAKLKNTAKTSMTADQLLETIFNLSDIDDNLKTLGKLKDEVERQQKKKFIFLNKIQLLSIIDSLTDRLIEMHKMILVSAER